MKKYVKLTAYELLRAVTKNTLAEEFSEGLQIYQYAKNQSNWVSLEINHHLTAYHLLTAGKLSENNVS